MTNYDIMNKEQKRKAINHKYEYTLKQLIYTNWNHRDITGTARAIQEMKTNLEILKKHNPNSEYIQKLEKFISDKEC